MKKAEAYQMGESRKVQAEAAVLEAEHLARAKAALAEAQRIEAERRAELEAPAKAARARVEVDAAAEAAKRRIEAEGEASAIFVKLEAEARGQYEILAKKGEGLQRIIEACGGSEQAFKMLMLEHFDHLVEASAKAISNIKFDKVVVWEGNGQNGTTRHVELAAQHGPHVAADDAGDARHRRRRVPREVRQPGRRRQGGERSRRSMAMPIISRRSCIGPRFSPRCATASQKQCRATGRVPHCFCEAVAHRQAARRKGTEEVVGTRLCRK